MSQVAQPFEDSLASFCSLALETACTSTRKSVSDFADSLESKPAFAAVVQASSVLERTDALRHGITGGDRYMVGTFLRRSGVYNSLYAGESPRITEVAGRFRALLLQSHVTVTYLAPIELIQLSRDRLEFESFAIRRFNQNELAVLTQNEIREVFYPWATLDLKLLEDYWFLVATDTIPARSSFNLADVFDARVGPLYTSHPQAIEKGLYPLVLHDWVDQFHPSNAGARPAKREPHDAPIYPHIPFVLTLSESWLEVPKPAPAKDELARDPHYDDEGEEIGDSPCCAFYFDESRTNKLEDDLRELATRLRLIDRHQPEWRFVYTALGFLTKAFQTRGVEQLLWHITAIEAILGQREAGLTSALKTRIAEVFGRSVKDKKDFKKRFDNLYRFRSDLVHGNSELDDQKIMKGHLAEARDFARGVVAWATGFLAHVAKHYPTETQPIPTRENLLLMLDMDAAMRSSVAALLQSVPSGFPALNDWLIYGESAGFPWGS
jgi:hypothetical protein